MDLSRGGYTVSDSEKNMISILLVEDDTALARGLCYSLEQEGWRVIHASTLAKSRESALAVHFSLVLLDVSLPDGSGFDFCRELVETFSFPVIFLTACDEEVNVVMGLDLGGDDYITKPFRVQELLSRVRAVLRRSGGSSRSGGPSADEPEICRSGDITIDGRQCRVWKGGSPVSLTATEYRLLRLLAHSGQMVLTREKLMELLWDNDEKYVDSNTLSVYIRRLREKIEDRPDAPLHIETVRGLGYRWR